MEVTAVQRDELLRRALELALAVAQAGQRLRPPLAIPAALKPFVRFQKLPANALAVVRRAVDDDDDFRVRLAAVATDELVGAAGVLWLARPEGWEGELARLVLDEATETERREAGRQERTATKRLEASEAAASRARADLAVATEELSRERERRQRAEVTAKDGAQARQRLDGELAASRRELKSARDQVASLRVSLDQAVEARQQLSEQRESQGRRLDETLRALVEARSESGSSGAASPVVSGGRDSAALVAAGTSLQDAARGLAALASSLADTAAALTSATVSSPAPRASVSGPRRPRPARRPLSIPGGLYTDAPEVAAHLVRVPDVVLVVDGYNVAKTAWPDLELAMQRERLLVTLEDLVRRVGTRVHVVFDGADLPAPSTGRRLLHVRFSPAGVSADDVIRDLVADLPAEQAVVVVTTDNAVVVSVRAMGANTLSSAQFLAGLAR